MLKISLVLALALSFATAHAQNENRFKLTEAENAKLRSISDSAQILKCAIFYYFDGFLDSFGIGISLDKPNPNESEEDQEYRKFQELRAFLNTDKLTLRSASERPKTDMVLTKELARNCHVIAQSVIEAQALQIRLMDPAGSAPTSNKKPQSHRENKNEI